MRTKRILSLLLSLALVFGLLPMTALAAHAYTSKVKLTEPVEGEKPSTEATSSNNDSAGAVKAGALVDEIVSVTWSGELDANGCFKAGVAYTVTVVDRISQQRWDVGTFTSRTATINLHKATIVSLTDDDHVITISYTFPTLKGNAQIAQEAAQAAAEKQAAQDAKRTEQEAKEHATQLTRRWSLAEANAPQNRSLDNPVTIVVRDDPEVLNMDLGFMKSPQSGWKGFRSELYQQDRGEDITRAIKAFRTLDGQLIPKEGFDTLRITRVVYDFYREIDFSLVEYGNVKEFWLGPNCDINGILNTIGRYYVGNYAGGDHGDFYNYDCILFIPESKYPNGPIYNTISGRASDSDLIPGCRVMLYSGDVYEAAKKGVSAARDWCTSHTYTAEIASPDRLYSTLSCSIGERYYYSCSKCGKCEFNAKHTFDGNDFAHKHQYAGASRNTTAHDYEVKNLSDEHFLGINANGDRVYLYACKYCGKDYRYHQLNMTYEEFKADTGETREVYQVSMDRYKKWWAEGGSTYEKAIKATVDKDAHNCFAVPASTYVTAKHSGWARDDLNKASQEGLIDKSLLGDNYTSGITRLQFASVAVKMTEKMTGKSISPAPAGTFTDTDNAYALKAYAAGITAGTGDGSTFSPNGILTRQQMATFLYRALQYVKANSDTEYSPYTSKLSNYSDAGQIESWAKDAMAFMNAFSLVSGTSDTALSPNASCTIEQSVIVALRSLDAGMLGWYQYAGDKRVGYQGLGSTSKDAIIKGDRIWVTAIDRSTSSSSYKTTYRGVCVNSYGRSCTINLTDFEFMSIKDR